MTDIDTNEDKDETETNEDEDSEVDDPENSVRLDKDIGLEPKFNNLLDALTRETFIHHNVTRPRPSTASQVRTTIDCLLANLVRAYLRGPAWFVAIPLATRDYTQSKYLRYRDRGIGYDNLRRVIGYLLEGPKPLITLVDGVNSSRVTRLRATGSLMGLLKGEDGQNDVTRSAQDGYSVGNSFPYRLLPITGRISLSYQSIVHTGSVDCIRLKGPKVREKPKKDRESSAKVRERLVKAKASLIDYTDNAETEGMRTNLTTWNTSIRSHLLDLFVADKDFEQIFDKKKRKIDLTRTSLYRVFNNSTFDQGGRCYGGWWQGVPKRWRPYITIDNSPTRELDYSNLHPAILYARKGLLSCTRFRRHRVRCFMEQEVCHGETAVYAGVQA